MSRRHVGVSFALVSIGLSAVLAGGAAANAQGPTSVSGQLEVLHEDHLEQGRSIHRYHLVGADGARTELLFDDRGPEGLGSRSVRVTGTPVRPGVLRVGSTSAVAESGTAPGTATPEATTSSTPIATKRVAVIMFDFTGSDPAERAVTVEEAKDAVFGELNTATVEGFLGESSYAQLGLTGAVASSTGDVFPWVRLSAAKGSACDYTAWGQQARSLAAAEHEFNDSAYDQVVHLMPHGSCGFGGVAYMPGKYSWTVLRQKGAPNVRTRLRGITAHEYGHSLGIHHSGSATCTSTSDTVVTLGTCTARAEYGDPFSVMGVSTNERQYTGYQKGRLGWLSNRNLTVTASGPQTLTSASIDGPGWKVLRIPGLRTKGSTRYFYVEFRTAAGIFDSAASVPGELTSPAEKAIPPVTGVYIRSAPDYGLNAISDLYDMTPGTAAGFDDAALPVGATFRDPASGVTIKLDAQASESASLTVTVPSSSTGKRK